VGVRKRAIRTSDSISPRFKADHLANTRVVHGIGDHERLRAHVPARADLDVLGIEPQAWIGALERALAEDSDLLVKAPAER
jgi:hypothetical protein